MPLLDNLTFSTRASAMLQDHQHMYGEIGEDDKHESYLLESSVAGYSDKSDWVVGIAYQAEFYRSETFAEFNYSYKVPGVFAQLDYELNDQLTTTYSAY